MNRLVIAAVLLITAVLPQPTASATGLKDVDPYKQGIRDYRRGHCFQARPYVLSDELKEALWIAGYHDAAEARDEEFRRRHRRYIEWPAKCHGPDNP